VVGDLADDLVDIYRDVSAGSAFHDAGCVDDAIWQWGFSFQTHWGKHASSAIRALHCYLSQEDPSSLSGSDGEPATAATECRPDEPAARARARTMHIDRTPRVDAARRAAAPDRAGRHRDWYRYLAIPAVVEHTSWGPAIGRRPAPDDRVVRSGRAVVGDPLRDRAGCAAAR
jgi:hypothetical protein